MKNIDIVGYENSLQDKQWSRDWDLEDGMHIGMVFSDGVLRVEIAEHESIEFDLNDFAMEKIGLPENEKIYVIEGKMQALNYRLYFHSLAGDIEEGEADLQNADFDFYYRVNE